MTLNIPEYAALALDRLEAAGYESYVVGGCVRDALLGRTPHDWDITTSASPEEVEAVFRGCRVLEGGPTASSSFATSTRTCCAATSP